MTITITKDMTLGEITSKHPESVEILLSYGLHCVGCGAAHLETLEKGAMVHGMSQEQLDQLVKDLNELVKDKKEEPLTDEPLAITDRAVAKVKEIQKEEKKTGQFLRVDVVPGGCAGYSYQFVFEDKQKEDDVLIEKDGLKVIIDQQAFDMMKGSRIDFIDSLQGSGFKVDNPNATAGCGCGKSFK